MVHYRTKTTKSAITPQKSPPSDSGDGNSETEGRDDTETLPVVGDALQRCDDDSSPPDFKKHSHQHRPHSEVARLRKQRSPQWSALFILLAMIAAVLLLSCAPMVMLPLPFQCLQNVYPKFDPSQATRRRIHSTICLWLQLLLLWLVLLLLLQPHTFPPYLLIYCLAKKRIKSSKKTE